MTATSRASRRAAGSSSIGGLGASAGSSPPIAKRFEARERNGAIERKFFVDGKQVGSDEGRKWLATFLPEMLRNMAVNADRRVARQLAKGGPALVLDEISKTESAFAKSVYLRSSTSRHSSTRRR